MLFKGISGQLMSGEEIDDAHTQHRDSMTPVDSAVAKLSRR